MFRQSGEALAAGLALIVALTGRVLAQPAPRDDPGALGLLHVPPDDAPQRLLQAPISPDILRGMYSLAPNVPQTPVTLAAPRGWRLGEWEARVRNRGDVPLNFAVMDGGHACAEEVVDPGTEILFLPCGGQLAWHDGHSVQRIALLRGGRYEMSWGDGRWVVSPLRR